MNSSPPLPAHHSLSHPGSPNHSHHTDDNSDYSLDLAALTNGGSASMPTSPAAMRKFDEIRSEDIDGPSDFTLNMEEWMRSTRRSKLDGADVRGTRNDRRIPFGTMKKGTVKGMFTRTPESHITEEQEEGDMISEQDQQGSAEVADHLVDSPVPNSPNFKDDREGSTTPRTAENRSVLDQTAEDGAWWKGKRFLQPTVEDHNSEMTPMRPISAPPVSRPSPPINMNRSQSDGLQKQELASKQGDESEQELARLRREVEELRTSREQSELRAQHLEDQLRASIKARQKLSQGQFNPTTDAPRPVDKALEDEPESIELEEQLSRSAADADEARRELSKAQSLIDELKTQLDEMRESEDAELHDLRWRVKGLAEGETRLTTDLEETRSSLQQARVEAAQLRADLDSERQAKQELQTRLEATTSPPHPADTTADLEAEVQKLMADLQVASDDAARLRDQLKRQTPPASAIGTSQAELAAARQEIGHLREELDLLQDLSRLDNDNGETQRASEALAADRADTEQLQGRLDDAMQKAAHFEALAGEHARQMDGLRSELASAKDEREKLLDELRRAKGAGSTDGVSDARLRESERKRLELHATADQLHLELAGLRGGVAAAKNEKERLLQELQRVSEASVSEAQLRQSEQRRLELHAMVDQLRGELEGMRQVNEEIDRRVSEGLRKREETWKAREVEWRAERKTMVKALMRGWGREEMGVDPGDEQRYKYRSFRDGKMVL